MSVQTFFSILFFIAFILYNQMGISLVTARKGSAMHAIFIAACLAMSIWSFAFSLSNSVQDYETALFWRRVASLGWGTIFGLFLHFILAVILKAKLIQKKWFQAVLYIPAFATVVAFGLHPVIAPGQYDLIYTSTGWMNQSVNNSIDWLYNLYYLSYTLIGLFLIVYAQRQSKVISKKAAVLLLMTIATTLIVSTITDMVLSIYFPGNVPQIAPLIILIPTLTIYYAIKRNTLIAIPQKVHLTEEGTILDEASHTKLYSGMAKTYLMGCYIVMISSYFLFGSPLKDVLSLSVILLMIGMLIEVINRTKTKSSQKDIMIAVITSATAPFVLLSFIEYSALTVWAAPIVLIMISILIKNRAVFVINSLSVVTSIIVVGIKAPTANVFIEASDHFARISLVVMFIFIASYIHRMFLKRLKENEDQVRRQKLISHISAEFSTINKSNIDDKFMTSLKQYVEDFDIDRSYVYLMSDDGKTANCTYECCAVDNNGLLTLVKQVEVTTCPWWIEQIGKCSTLNIPDISTLPNEALVEKSMVIGEEVKSLMLTPIVDDGKAVGFIGFDSLVINRLWSDVAVDIAEIIAHLFAEALRKIKSSEEIEYLAYFDALTGLPNRTLFNDRVKKEIERCKRTKEIMGILFIDLDSFKTVNDTLGHENGDEVLKKVATKLSQGTRAQDTVSRFGGDEFLIMITNIKNSKDMSRIADSIIKLFEGPVTLRNHEFFVTASMGISMFPEDGEHSVTLIKNADIAMYASKELGKNRYSFSSSLLKDDVMKKTKLTNHLYRAQERNELELYYQPQINLHTKKVIGVEALIRWNHPELGMIAPLDFIPLAEQTGLIIPIGEWVIRTACQQNMAWQSLGLPPLRMAVNLSVEQFRSMALVDTVHNILIETGMEPKHLELEITESIAIEGTDHIIEVLTKLKELGLTISIDDFGTEYSSLSRIKVLPIDRIKMDMNFVHSISKSSKDDAIVRIIIQLAKSLDLEVIAEGVESEPQLKFLNNNSCDEVQGFYYYKPMKAREVEEILKREADIDVCDLLISLQTQV